MPYQAEESSYHRKDKVSNFGRCERIGGNKWETYVDVDIDPQLEWTLVFDTKSIVVDASGVPLGRVIAKVDFGSGNGSSETIFDVTDFVALPIAGNHVKVAMTLVSTIDLQEPVAAGIPAPAPQTAEALACCFLSAGFSQRAFLSGGADHHVVPAFGEPPPPNAGLAGSATASPVPARLNALTAFNPTEGNLFLFLVSNPSILTPIPSAVLVKKVISLPPHQNIVIQYAQPVPFDRGLTWFASSSPDLPIVPAGVGIRVDLELVRRPTVKAVPVIAPTG